MKLGRIYVPDENDAVFPLMEIMDPQPPRTTPWQIGPVLNQGRTPECVAFTTRGWLNAEPVSDPDQSHPDPATIYAGAQANDGISGPHDGSNDRGAMKYMQSIGMVDSYHWAQSLQEVIQYVTTTGPLMCGTNWHQGQFTPDSNGFIAPVGPIEGGHEYLMYWYAQEENAFWFLNSWGTTWGNVPGAPGTFKMKAQDFGTLLNEGGDACAALLTFPRPVLNTP
jgi:hypothetical protein